MRPIDLPDETEQRLREWAWYFRDRRYRQQTCASAEKGYRRHSGDFEGDGVGEIVAPRQTTPRGSYSVLRAIQTGECISRSVDLPGRWALTYGYCYPGLPRHVVLSSMRRRTKHRINWGRFLDLLDAARVRVHTCLHIHAGYIDSNVNFR